MEEIQNQDTAVETTVEQKEKKERKKKDTSGEFRLYATTNPFNGEVVVKRFRQPEVPIGVIFVKYLEGTPEREKFAEFADGSSVWTWTTQQKRFDATLGILSRGKVKYLEKDTITGVTEILTMEEEPVVKKEKVVKAKRVPRTKEERFEDFEKELQGLNKLDPSQETFEFFGSEEPVEQTETTEPTEQETAEETQQFSVRKDAVEYAKTLGYSKKQIEDYVRKIDGFWTVVQS